jgi:outer membrane protein assembly factor BamE (lipoprotein component of BamABCDE complex)
MSNKLLILAVSLILSGCSAPGQRAQDQVQQADAKDQLTLGKVQQTLRKGMAKDEVVSGLGSPNMVTRDRSGNETWIYDKISTESSTAAASDRLGIFGIGIAGSALLGGSASTSTAASASKRSQKTLTVIVKFMNEQVSEFTYNTSSF